MNRFEHIIVRVRIGRGRGCAQGIQRLHERPGTTAATAADSSLSSCPLNVVAFLLNVRPKDSNRVRHRYGSIRNFVRHVP